MATPEEAQTVIQDLAENIGHLPEEMMNDLKNNWNPKYYKTLDKYRETMENSVSHSIKTLAETIYGSNARFIFELLQNADDNKFTKATNKSEVPGISFKIWPEKIIIECNEDGFTMKDLEAICSIGNSSKTTSHGYIGAKGIGFKSVFMVASSVHIQSGHFSFEFCHKPIDPGIGMVRPIWKTPNETLFVPMTRMTLWLRCDGSAEEIADRRGIIQRQFKELEVACLLFLKSLREISIGFYDNQGNMEESRHFTKRDVGGYRVALEATTQEPGTKSTKSRRLYHVTRQNATNLPHSSNRKLEGSEENLSMAKKAEVVLAFPLTEGTLIEGPRPSTDESHKIFAFLPLEKSLRYKFLIHSDFDTNASREDILVDSERNLSLLDWIAMTFVLAARQFSEQEYTLLSYEWPLFLPTTEGQFDKFWSNLDRKIQERIKDTPLFQSRNRIDLRKLNELCILPSDACLEDGKPVLEDATQDIYFSRGYTAAVIRKLKQPAYGLELLSTDMFLALLRKDLSCEHSKMRNASTSSEWHSVVAKLIAKIGRSRGIHNIELLPLRDGTWVTGMDTPVYLPTIGKFSIPAELNLQVLEPSAVANDERKGLFLKLGATEAPINTVRSSILQGFSQCKFSEPVDHLRFLYQTSPPQMELHVLEPVGNFEGIYLTSSNQRLIWPSLSDVYLLQDSDPYGPHAMLSDCDTIQITYADSIILRDPPPRPSEDHPTWVQWLHGCIGVRSRLRLLNLDNTELSETSRYVLSHKPSMFLGLLEYLWKDLPTNLTMNAALRQHIGEINVRSICNFGDDITLQESWFPLENLRETVGQFMENPAAFPFLQIESPNDSFTVIPWKWKFLSYDFHISKGNDLSFLLDILWYIYTESGDDSDDSDDSDDPENSEASDDSDNSEESEGSEYSYNSDSSVDPDRLSTIQLQKLCNLYAAIYARLVLSKDMAQERNNLMEAFYEPLIYIPDDDAPYWAELSECRWRGPTMTTTNTLQSLYGRILGDEQMTSLELLFSKTLMISDVSSEDVIAELKLIKDDWLIDPEKPNLNGIKTLYRYLLESENCVASEYSDEFRSEALIYAKSQGDWGWYKSPDCLWSSKTSIQGKAVLNTHYEEFEDLFIGDLGVKCLTLEMVYDELCYTTLQDVAEIKSKISVFSGFLAAEPTDLNPALIFEASIFPIKHPNNPVAELVNGNIDFIIADRDYLRQRFESKVKILDFNLEDVRRLTPFFEWLGLGDRYLSKRVREITSVGTASGVVASSATRSMQRKARSLIQIAATFDSPRYEDDKVGLLFQQLRSVSVVETDNLSATLSIMHDNRQISIAAESGSVHIAETINSMTIYVPKGKKAQRLCFSSVLPTAYAKWLMLNPRNNRQSVVTNEMVTTLMCIFTCPSSASDVILDRCGIFKPSSFSDNYDNLETEDEDSDEDNTASHTLTPSTGLGSGTWNDSPDFSGAFSPAYSISERSETVGRDVYENGTRNSSQTLLGVEHARSGMSQQRQLSSLAAPVQQPVLAHPSTTSNSRSSISPYLGNGQDTYGQYEILLQRVVTAARSGEFPQITAMNLQALADALPGSSDAAEVESYDGPGVNIRSGSMSQLERDKRVGAAGELYVYELLKKVGLPGWDSDNWQSRIRTYARAHPDHALLEAWTRSETSDLVYDDSEGFLTGKLMAWGYLAPEEWQGARPKYYLEVKTTTGRCETPFFASGKQYRLMDRMHASGTRSEVYIILRVFSLNSDRIGMRVYVDPVQLRNEERLLFTTQTWSVVPGPGRAPGRGLFSTQFN